MPRACALMDAKIVERSCASSCAESHFSAFSVSSRTTAPPVESIGADEHEMESTWDGGGGIDAWPTLARRQAIEQRTGPDGERAGDAKSRTNATQRFARHNA
jgi:hypothetical protein